VAREFGHISHGYTVTSHASQGKTVDCVFVGRAVCRFLLVLANSFYVSCSRGRKSVTVYCDDKAALRDAVAESDERVTATELVNGLRQREVVALQERYHNQTIERPAIQREERNYER